MNQVHDLGDWVKACYVAQTPRHIVRAITNTPVDASVRVVDRTFSADMSVATVRDQSAAWHEAVALGESSCSRRLPPPWREAETLSGLTITPLATIAEIVAEGRAMHHCARTRIDPVAFGEAYLFSVRNGEQRVATVEVRQHTAGRVEIAQMRGPCNAVLNKKVQDILRRWAGQRGKWQRPKLMVDPRWSCASEGPVADDDDDLPLWNAA